MSELLVGLKDRRLPPMYRVIQHFSHDHIADVALSVERELERPEIAAQLRPGRTAAVAVGSRGISNLVTIVTALVSGLKRRGLKVFIVPTMGSHGGATEQGQRDVLAHYGITEASVGASVRSSMDTQPIGALRHDPVSGSYIPAALRDEGSIPLFADRIAWNEADLIIPIVRVKPHTGFRGPVESGI